jgi:hypothetical protein
MDLIVHPALVRGPGRITECWLTSSRVEPRVPADQASITVVADTKKPAIPIAGFRKKLTRDNGRLQDQPPACMAEHQIDAACFRGEMRLDRAAFGIGLAGVL